MPRKPLSENATPTQRFEYLTTDVQKMANKLHNLTDEDLYALRHDTWAQTEYNLAYMLCWILEAAGGLLAKIDDEPPFIRDSFARDREKARLRNEEKQRAEAEREQERATKRGLTGR